MGMNFGPFWAEQEQYERDMRRARSTTSRYEKTRQAMKITQMIESKYLKQADVEDETLVSVKSLKKVNVARDDEEPEYRWTVQFHEFDKPMVLNATNIKRMAKALGDDTDDWIGNQVVLYVDPDVEFGGNVVGGLRVRAVNRAKSAPKTPLTMAEANRRLDSRPDDDAPPF